jgi:hypothetical protein
MRWLIEGVETSSRLFLVAAFDKPGSGGSGLARRL